MDLICLKYSSTSEMTESFKYFRECLGYLNWYRKMLYPTFAF